MPEIDRRVQQRAVGRHGSAALRAVSGRPTAELRANRLTLAGRSVALATPYIAVDLTDGGIALARSRGVVDAMALLLRHTDLELHDTFRPQSPLECVVFDLLEQLRCETLVQPALLGVQRNLASAFDAWCRSARSERVAESGVGLLIYTVVHMVRGRLVTRMLDPEVDEIIETTRGHLAALIGHALAELPRTRHSQRAYAVPALEIARLVAELADDAGEQTAGTPRPDDRLRLFAPPHSDLDEHHENPVDSPVFGSTAPGTPGPGELESLGDYHVYTRSYDREVTGTSLYPESQRAHLRRSLDRLVAAQAVSVSNLARRSRLLLAQPMADGWRFAEETGVIDASRLGQLVANPTHRHIFRQDRIEPQCDAVVTFLVDTSGSMKTQRYEAVAVLIDTFCRALDLAGISSEVLGFTTGAWNGGRALRDWSRAGRPGDPGRLNEVQHIVYKDADTSWRRSRLSLCSMMRTHHFREGLDSEALIWAHQRLSARPERRKLLVVVSDGVPMDAATANANRSDFLADHLRHVAAGIERSSPVELGALAIDSDVADFYRNSASVDLNGTLTLADYRCLELLFGPGARS